MSIRPVDLQQVVVRATDVGRDAPTQQQAAAAQQAQASDQSRRQAQQAETVQGFEEAGAVLIRERQGRSQQEEREEHPKQEQPAEDTSAADGPQLPGGAPRPPLGRHIDLSI